MRSLAVLISNVGTGSNLQAIIDAQNQKTINAKITAVISSTPDAQGIKRAKKNNISVKICPKKEDLLPILEKLDPDYLVLAGWKQIITDEVIDKFKNHILNVHPGLIPDEINGTVNNPDGTNALWNKGLLAQKAIQNFLDKKATYAGSSIHFLTHEFDFGPVLERGFVKVEKGDTVDSLYKRVKQKEHEIYIKALQKLCKNTVLVIDGGGRGSTLVDKYLESPHVDIVLAVPGNDLMLENTKKTIQIFPDVKTTDIKNILKIAKSNNVDLVDVAQDDAVAVGVTDALIKEGFQAFGPTKSASQIEWDKAWARKFMQKLKLPIPKYEIFHSEKDGLDFINRQKESQWYIKAAGLTRGKGVLHAKNNKDAKEKIKQMHKFNKSGQTFLIEKRKIGEEFSSYAIIDGKNFILLGHAQDHKTIFNNNKGPNTGGIGSTSTPLCITKNVERQIKLIFEKTAQGLVSVKRPYMGILYLGGMIDEKGKVYIIEFNARWGDPEAEVVIPSIKNDFYNLALQTLAGKLSKVKISKDNIYRVVVTAVSKGYPLDYSKAVGKQIFGLDKLLKSEEVKIYGAAVKKINGKFTVGGGRLFHVMAEGKDVAEARQKAYNALSKIKVEGGNLHYRTDIGYRDFERMRNPERSRTSISLSTTLSVNRMGRRIKRTT